MIILLIAGCGGGGGSSAGPGPGSGTLASISVTPINPSVSIGTSEQFVATGTYSDNSTRDITTSVTWSSSAPSVATIINAAGSNGMAAAIAVGTTTITAASGSISGFTTLKVTTGGSGITGNNVLSITVNGSLCSSVTSSSYPNKPCVSVTVCNPGGSSTCQTINDILLDTGSFGLRIFKSILGPAMAFKQVAAGSGLLAECAQFGDGSSLWGPVQLAGVTLASEPTVTVPIQLIDSTFVISTSSTSTICPGAEQSPATAGFNGILGVGVFSVDCGQACTSALPSNVNNISWPYYSCSGSTCSPTPVPLSDQVQNPVALLPPPDNNGVIVMLPSVPSSGAASVNGVLVLGIGTQTNNNVPSGVTMYATDRVGEIITIFGSATYSSVIDSGSNGLFFTPPSVSQLRDCPSPNAGWFCPSSTVSLSATNAGASGSPSGVVSFQIGNFNSLANSSNMVFSNIGGNAPGPFDWGLPFYFGRDVYVGIEGKGSSLGTGPYWGY